MRSLQSVVLLLLLTSSAAQATTWNQRSSVTDTTCEANLALALTTWDSGGTSTWTENFTNVADTGTSAGSSRTFQGDNLLSSAKFYNAFVTPLGVPNNLAWENGTITIHMNITVAASLGTATAYVFRVKSDCTVAYEGFQSSTVGLTTTGVKTFSITPTWTTTSSSSGDRFVLAFTAAGNTTTAPSWTAEVNVGTNEDVATPISIGAGSPWVLTPTSVCNKLGICVPAPSARFVGP